MLSSSLLPGARAETFTAEIAFRSWMWRITASWHVSAGRMGGWCFSMRRMWFWSWFILSRCRWHRGLSLRSVATSWWACQLWMLRKTPAARPATSVLGANWVKIHTQTQFVHITRRPPEQPLNATLQNKIQMNSKTNGPRILQICPCGSQTPLGGLTDPQLMLENYVFAQWTEKCFKKKSNRKNRKEKDKKNDSRQKKKKKNQDLNLEKIENKE